MEFVAPNWSLLLAATAASAAASFTPGPNNTICAGISATHGFRRALPFVLGVTVGFPLLLLAVGLGLGGVLRAYPQLRTVTQVAGAVFLLYLAYRIITAPPFTGNNTESAKNTPGFFRAVLFQWVNPKALSFMLSLIALYLRPQALATDLPLLMLISAIMALGSTLLWSLAGVAVGRFLKTRRRHRIFNAVMGMLLILAAVDIFRR